MSSPSTTKHHTSGQVLTHPAKLAGQLLCAALVPTDTGGVVLVVLKGYHDSLIPTQTSSLGPLDGFEHTSVVPGHDFHEFGRKLVPHGEDAPAEFTVVISGVTLDHLLDVGYLLGILEGLEGYCVEITSAAQIASLVQHVSDPAGHASGKVATRLTKHHHASTRHILTAMVPNGFYHGPYTAIAHPEALARHAADIRFATGCPIKCHVTDNDVFFRYKGRAGWWIEDNLAARQPFTKIVVGIAFQFQGDSLGHEGAKTLPSRALKV